MNLPKRIASKLRRMLLGSTFYKRITGKDPFRSSLNELDQKLEQYLNFDHGFFVELGANDGFTQSNTYYFEKRRHWSGVLVEPIPELCQKARVLRKKSKVFNYACVPFGYPESKIKMRYANLMSMVADGIHDKAAEDTHIMQGEQVQALQSYDIWVPARTLTSILDEAEVKGIDLLSLDVEGFEADVLMGLDFSKYRPKYILVELIYRTIETERIILDNNYELVEKLSNHDVLFRDML